MLTKKRDGLAGLQVESAVDVSRDCHKLRFRPYRQSNSLSSKSSLEVNANDPPKECQVPHSPKHVHQPHHQSSSSSSSNNNNNNNNQGNEHQHQNQHHNHNHLNHHHHHHNGSRLARGSTHQIPDGRVSPAKIDLGRRERRAKNNKRSNSLFTQHVTHLQHLDNSPRAGQISAPTSPTSPITSSTLTTTTTPTPLPVSSDTGAVASSITPPEYGSDRRKILIQQRRYNGQFAGYGAVYTSDDANKTSKVSGLSSQHHFNIQHQYSGHNQPSQHRNYQTAIGNVDHDTCHSHGNEIIRRGSDRATKGFKYVPAPSKRGEKERQTEKNRPNSSSSIGGNRDCPSRNGSFTGPSNGLTEASKKRGAKSGRNTPLTSENVASVKVTDSTDPGGGQNNSVFSYKSHHSQQNNQPHYEKKDLDQRSVRTNGNVRVSEGHLAKEGSNRGVNPLGSMMKWEYEDLYSHLNKTSGDRMTPVRSVRPKSAGVSARTHTAMTDSDDSSLDGDIEYVDLEDISDGEDVIVATDSEVAANSKQRVPKSWKDNCGGGGGGSSGGGGGGGGSVGIRRAYSMKDNQANSLSKEGPRYVNNLSQEARRLRCKDSSGGKSETKWPFADKTHANYQKMSRRETHLRVEDSTEAASNSSYHRHLNAKKDMFDLSSFKDNLSFSQTDSLMSKGKKKLRNGNVCFSVTGEQLAPEGLRHLKGRQCGFEATESQRTERGEAVPRRNAPFPRRLKPLFGNIAEDSES